MEKDLPFLLWSHTSSPPDTNFHLVHHTLHLNHSNIMHISSAEKSLKLFFKRQQRDHGYWLSLHISLYKESCSLYPQSSHIIPTQLVGPSCRKLWVRKHSHHKSQYYSQTKKSQLQHQANDILSMFSHSKLLIVPFRMATGYLVVTWYAP